LKTVANSGTAECLTAIHDFRFAVTLPNQKVWLVRNGPGPKWEWAHGYLIPGRVQVHHRRQEANWDAYSIPTFFFYYQYEL